MSLKFPVAKGSRHLTPPSAIFAYFSLGLHTISMLAGYNDLTT